MFKKQEYWKIGIVVSFLISIKAVNNEDI